MRGAAGLTFSGRKLWQWNAPGAKRIRMRPSSRLSALVFAALLAVSCGDDSSTPSDDDTDEQERDSGASDAGRMDGSVKVTDASTDATVRRDAATKDAAAAVVDASVDAGGTVEDAGPACFLAVCSNPFDCIRNLDNCGKVICNMEKNVCE